MNRTRRDMRYAIGKGLKDRRCTWFIRLIPHLVSSGWGMEGREMNHVNDRFLPRNSPSVRFRSSRVPLVTSPPTSLPHHSPTFHLPYGAGTAGERMVSGGEGGGMARTPRIHPAYRSYFLGSVVLSSHSPPVTPFRAHFVHSPLRAVGEWNETEWVSERNRDDSEAEGNGVRRWHDTRRPGTRRNRFRSPCVISSRSLHFVSPLSGLRSVLRPSLIPFPSRPVRGAEGRSPGRTTMGRERERWATCHYGRMSVSCLCLSSNRFPLLSLLLRSWVGHSPFSTFTTRVLLTSRSEGTVGNRSEERWGKGRTRPAERVE